jgi:diguanylate cyclase (GGDEF)-like protein
MKLEDGSVAVFEIVDCSHRGAELVRHRREELIGKTISALYSAAKPDRLMAALREAMQKGTFEGEVEVSSDSPFTTQWAHLKIMRSDGDLAVTLRDISDSKAHVAELERRGNEDTLTGLPNRHWVQTYLPKAIERAASDQSMLAILFIDLDGFKQINDRMGHAAGDDVLRSAARRIKDAVRPHDCVVRLGGDEFVVILEAVTQNADAAHVAERILHAFQDDFRLTAGIHSVGASIGISVFPHDGTDADTLLQHADIAMYSVKTSGKRNYRFFDQRFYESLRARLEQEAELRHAIEHDQFVMYYQPRIDISTGVTSSMEALVRWAHPTKGLINPAAFIPLAEETGVILSLGELVIDKVCSQLAIWTKAGKDPVPVSINVSSRQFNESDIANILSVTFARHKIDAKLIEIELTESSMMGDSQEVAQALRAIQIMGIKLLVDDFGTGYSSLAQLQRLDFDLLKVDQAFTARLEKTKEGSVFFLAIITMAHALGMRVVAEGVETEAQAEILKALQCDELQGFYISRPLAPSDMEPFPLRRIFPSKA